MAKKAIVLHEGVPSSREVRIGRMLDFFGVPFQFLSLAALQTNGQDFSDCAVFAPIHLMASLCNGKQSKVPRPEAFFVYADNAYELTRRGLRSVFGDGDIELRSGGTKTESLHVSREMPGLVGPMAGLDLSVQLRSEDGLLEGGLTQKAFSPIISAGNAAVFVHSVYDGAPVFFSSCSEIVDLDEPLTKGFYDVREHFCAAVPIVMFIRFLFAEVAWKAQEIGGCLIIDDPLLKPRYGFCNFPAMRDLMRRYRFTTNIAFIPWNWRRSSKKSSHLFRNEPDLFSVSIHGCDHTGGEFGATSVEALQGSSNCPTKDARPSPANWC